MSRKNRKLNRLKEQTAGNKKQKADLRIYWRLLSYVKPYKWRLIAGLLAGVIASGSLFGGMMLLPQLVKGVDATTPESIEENRMTAVRIIHAMQQEPGLNMKEQEQKINRILAAPKSEVGALQKNLEKIDRFLQKMFPASWKIHTLYDKGKIRVIFFGHLVVSLPAEDEYGKMTWQFFSIFVLGFILTWVIRNVFIYLNHYYMRWVGTRVVADLRQESFRRLMNQSMKFFGQVDIGQMISRTTNDTAAMESAVANSIADATRCPLEILACIAAVVIASMRFNNWLMPCILLVGLPLCLLPLMIISRRIRKFYRKSFQQIAVVVQRMHEILSGIVVVKAYHAENREVVKFSATNNRYFLTVVRALRQSLMMPPLMEVVSVSLTLVFFVFSYSQGVTLTELVQLLTPCLLAYNPIKALSRVVANVQKSLAAADRYFQLMDIDTSLKEIPQPVILTDFKDCIKLEHVTFAYEQHQILDSIDLAIPKGQVVAVVGSTGSGKSTIASLIARFYDVNGGRVTIDGIDVRDVQIASLRNQIGIVNQDAILFNDTIANNIAYGVPGASMEQIREAARQANAETFIMDDKHALGYETVVGERGCLLSGGEKQRISIARAILRNPPILILDEATSALDTVTEKLVQDALARVMENRTVLAIAHRLSTIKNADKIIVLEQGKIIEAGTHDELLALNGKYKELYDIQFSRDRN